MIHGDLSAVSVWVCVFFWLIVCFVLSSIIPFLFACLLIVLVFFACVARFFFFLFFFSFRQVRVVFWKCKDVVSMDKILDQNDLFVRSWVEGVESQETDTHW